VLFAHRIVAVQLLFCKPNFLLQETADHCLLIKLFAVLGLSDVLHHEKTECGYIGQQQDANDQDEYLILRLFIHHGSRFSVS
jgi:hypothetical protein